MLLLKQDTISKERVKKVPELNAGNKGSNKYKVEAIWNSAVYAKKSKGYLPGLYYLVAWKDYPEEESTWKPALVVQHLKKLISLFHKNHPKKLIATSALINSALSMARPIIKLTAKATTKPNQGRPANIASKRAKNWAHTYLRDNQPLIRQGLDGSSFFHQFLIFSNLIYKSIGFSSQAILLG